MSGHLTIRKLEPFDGALDGESVLAPVSGPAVSGDAESALDWHCDNCDTLLAARVDSRQLLDILIKCYFCGEIGALPRRSPGDPVGSSTLVLNPGIYLLSGAANVSSAAVIGERAVRAYTVEVGRVHQDRLIAITDSLMLSEKNLLDLAKKAAALLGAEYEKLLASDRRGLASATPPPRRHRVIELIVYAQDLAEQLARSSSGNVVSVDEARLTELMAIVGLFERWRNHPAYAQLLATLTSDVDVSHTVMLLAVASELVDAGNGVGIVHQDEAGRIPDIRLLATGNERAEVEIKAPDFLHGPLSADPSDLALEKKLTRLVNDSASSNRGQLDPFGSGMLAICGFHFSPALMSKLVASARKVLGRQKGRKPHLIAIAFFDLNCLEVRAGTGSSIIMPVVNRELVLHPSYSGKMSLSQNPPQRTVSPGQLGPTA